MAVHRVCVIKKAAKRPETQKWTHIHDMPPMPSIAAQRIWSMQPWCLHVHSHASTAEQDWDVLRERALNKSGCVIRDTISMFTCICACINWNVCARAYMQCQSARVRWLESRVRSARVRWLESRGLMLRSIVKYLRICLNTYMQKYIYAYIRSLVYTHTHT